MIPGTLIKATRRWAVLAMLTSAGVCGGLALAEASLQMLDVKAPELPYDGNSGDPVLGMKPLPNRRDVANFPDYPGELLMTTNNFAFYEEQDTSPVAAPDVRRLAVVGDSFVVCPCKADESFTNQLESLLNAEGGGHYEFINAGIGRHSPYQYLLHTERDIVPLRPARLVVTLYMGNDFLDLIRQDDRPYLVRTADGRVEAHPPVFITYDDPTRPLAWYESTRLWQLGRAALGPTLLYQISRVRLLHRNLSAMGRGPTEIAEYMMEVKKLDQISHGIMAQSLHQYVWFRHFPETLDTARFFSRHVIESFAKLGRRENIELVFVIMPSKPTIEAWRLNGLFDQLSAIEPGLAAAGLAAFENRLADEALATCRELGIPTVDLRPGLAEAARGGELYYPHDMHLNVAGNQAAARILAAADIGKPIVMATLAHGVPGLPSPNNRLLHCQWARGDWCPHPVGFLNGTSNAHETLFVYSSDQ